MARIDINSDNFQNLKKSGYILREILNNLEKNISQGNNLLDIEAIVDKNIIDFNAKSSCKNYDGFPASVCISVNETIVHGIPYDYVIKNGDLVSIDLGIDYKGMFTDSAITLNFSDLSDDKKLCRETKKALANAISIIKPGIKTGDIGYIISKTAEKAKLKVIHDLTGHGTGLAVHEKPTIYNFGEINRGTEIQFGDVLAIEPMFSLKSEGIISNKNGWSIKTKNGDKSAHFEHTIYVGKKEAIILT